MVDKDGVFLDSLDDMIHNAWNNGEITNEIRNQLVYALREVRDYL